VTATLNSACNSFSQPVSKEQHLVDHVIREFAATIKYVQKLQPDYAKYYQYEKQ